MFQDHAIKITTEIKMMPLDLALAEAVANARARAKLCKIALPRKPAIRVCTFHGKALFVMIVGRYFVSSHTWDGLIRKAANPYGWSRLNQSKRYASWGV